VIWQREPFDERPGIQELPWQLLDAVDHLGTTGLQGKTIHSTAQIDR